MAERLGVSPALGAATSDGPEKFGCPVEAARGYRLEWGKQVPPRPVDDEEAAAIESVTRVTGTEEILVVIVTLPDDPTR